MLSFFYYRFKSLDKLTAVGCDGTNTNTGKHRGTIRLLELELQKPLQWLVCQLHANELPFRHLLIHRDGSTSGPRGFSGPLGKQFAGCEKLPLVVFAPIDDDLPNMTDL